MASHPAQTRAGPGDPVGRRWRLIRDLAVFSAKAAIEALRDIVLIPLALVAGVVGLLTDREHPDAFFRRVLHGGRRFDRWLNLFGRRTLLGSPRTIDGIFGRLETIVVEQHQRGGITVGAKDAIDRAIDHIQKERSETESIEQEGEHSS